MERAYLPQHLQKYAHPHNAHHPHSHMHIFKFSDPFPFITMFLGWARGNFNAHQSWAQVYGIQEALDRTYGPTVGWYILRPDVLNELLGVYFHRNGYKFDVGALEFLKTLLPTVKRDHIFNFFGGKFEEKDGLHFRGVAPSSIYSHILDHDMHSFSRYVFDHI